MRFLTCLEVGYLKMLFQPIYLFIFLKIICSKGSYSFKILHLFCYMLLFLERDVIAQAQSGTGKTATFSVSVLQNIDETVPEVQALVMAPTRELAQQVGNLVFFWKHFFLNTKNWFFLINLAKYAP